MKSILIVVALTFSLLLTACGAPPETPPPAAPAELPAPEPIPTPPPPPPPVEVRATAVLAPTEGNAAAGTLTLVSEAEGVRISGTLTGVAPGGTHGFHVHETGDCSASDASSAGGHFNPNGHAHGHPGQGEHHAGDMPNVVADENGNLMVDLHVPGLSLADSGAMDILGRALVLHAGADDYTSQPAGDSGPRIACGVIQQ